MHYDAQVFLAAEGVPPGEVPAEEILKVIVEARTGDLLMEAIEVLGVQGKASPVAIAQLWAAKELIINACKMGDSMESIMSPDQLVMLCPLLKKARVDLAFVGMDSRNVPMLILGGNYIEKISQAFLNEKELSTYDTREVSKLLYPEVQMMMDYGVLNVIVLTRMSGKKFARWIIHWPPAWAKYPEIKNRLANKLKAMLSRADIHLLDVMACR
jgi:hypothetical protein